MKSLLRAAAIVSFIALAVSCGVASDNSISNDDLTAKSFDPMASYAQVKKLAGAYTSGVSAVSLSATRNASAPASSSSTGSFTWIWTVAGEDGIFVDVEISSSGAKVLNHERGVMFTGQATFDPAKVSVNGADVLAIAQSAQKSGQPSDLYLGASFLSAGASSPRWTVGYANSELTIDGESGDLIK